MAVRFRLICAKEVHLANIGMTRRVCMVRRTLNGADSIAISWHGSMAEQALCKRHVAGSTPAASSTSLVDASITRRFPIEAHVGLAVRVVQTRYEQNCFSLCRGY